MPEIVGIGAVNVDYIIDSQAAASALSGDDPQILAGFEPGSERAATSAQIDETLQRLGPLNPVASPGGSSLNTLASIAATGADVSVGYIGVRGRSGTSAFSLLDWFAALNIDDRHVADDDDLAGICISYTDGGQRSMLTTPGANRSIMEYLSEHSVALIEYLKQAKLIHVTSLTGLNDITPLVKILAATRAANPAVQICCDPGAPWTNAPLPTGLDALLKLSDWILVNQLEFTTYSEGSGSEDDHLRAAASTFGPADAKAALLLKRSDRIEVFTKPGGQILHQIYPNSVVLHPDDIVDDTGAGDAFAAGLLISLVTPAMSQGGGIELGFRLAREKLGWPGLGGLDHYAQIYDTFIADS